MTRPAAAILALLVGASACGTPTPGSIAYGEDLCDYCHMSISDPSHAAQLVTLTSRRYRFDDVGCLAAFVAEGRVPPDRVHSLWVNSYLEPAELLVAADAAYLRSEELHSPMGSQLAALPPGPQADSLLGALGGTLLRWDEVLEAPHGPAESHIGSGPAQ